jgi:D-alanyl-D-alanine carboxypeptidase (penicillin-binding protein 5/6)
LFFASELPLELCADADYITVVPKGELRVFMESDTDPETDFLYTQKLEYESLSAPVSEGMVVGSMTISRGEEILGSVELVTANSAQASTFLHTMKLISDFTASRFFIASCIAAVAISLSYVFIKAAVLQKRKKRRGGSLRGR